MDVFQYDGLEVAAGEAGVVEKNVESVMGQVLRDCQRPGNVGAAIAMKTVFSMRAMAELKPSS